MESIEESKISQVESVDNKCKQKLEYDPSRSGPMNKLRSTTDFKYLIALLLFCLIWLCVAFYAYAHGNVDNAYEVPVLKNVFQLTKNDEQGLVSLFKKSSNAHKYIAMSAILSILCIISLRWLTKFIIYTLIFLVFAILSTIICVSMVDYHFENHTEAFFLSILTVLLFLGLLIIFLMIRQKIKIVCEVIQESCKFVMFIPSTLIFSLFSYFLYIMVIAFAVSVFINLATIPKHEEPQFYIYFLHLINLFGLLWLYNFVTAFSQMILSGTFATWYWLHDKRFVPYLTLMYFMENTLKYHLGTLAFGSLILTPCCIIRSLLNFIKKILPRSCNSHACPNLGWYQDLFGNLEKKLNCLSHYAYFMCASHGKDFFQSSIDSYNLRRNFVIVLVYAKLKDWILIVIQLIIIAFPMFSAWVYNHYWDERNLMIGIVMIGSTIMSSSLFMVLKTSIDTILLCVLEDCKKNDGSEGKPYMNNKLKNLVLE